MKIAILGNYPPKACGIATFTNSLARAFLANLTAERISDFAEIIAIEDEGQEHAYPEEVTLVLPKNDREAYRTTAGYLNEGSFDLLIVQHEYGIFGGADGIYLLDLIDRLRIPMMVTCHTVLKKPSEGQRSVLRRLCVRANVMVVMSEIARTFLEEVYNCQREKIQIIEHGVPVIMTDHRRELRERYGWSDRRVLFTFGLLGRGKGIETVIRALPAVVAEHPNTLYVVIGKTHPNVVRDQGEEYRDWLHELAEELGVRDNLFMISEFASEQYLFECLKATDLYVIPYPNEAQITSGTLAYAIGAGAAVISTPFWHATELLAEGRGRLFPFNDSQNLGEQLLELLGKPKVLAEIRYKALEYGKDLFWPKIGGEYISAFADAKLAFEESISSFGRNGSSTSVPALNLEHLIRMTDDCGILQHAKYATPNRFEGYCLDDNGRALLFACMALESRKLNLQRKSTLLDLTGTYLAYIYHAQNEDGSFRNFMSYQRSFLEPQGSEDSYGRALWGLAKCVASSPRPDLAKLAGECFIRAIGHLDLKTSPRTIAYGVIALSDYLAGRADENLRNLLDRSVNRLLVHYEDNRRDDWEWFEPYLTYDNALLPLALYASLKILPKDRVLSVAKETRHFLANHTVIGNIPRPVGCHQACHIGDAPLQFDQQPLELMAEVLLHVEAFKHQGRPADEQLARIAYSWFHGNNDLGAAMYCPETGGCFDGLTMNGPNQNQGAESLLAYLVSTAAMEQLPEPQNRGEDTRQKTLKRMLNGFAPAWVGEVGQKVTEDKLPANYVASATAFDQHDLDLSRKVVTKPSVDYPLLKR